MAALGDVYAVRLFTALGDQAAVNVRHYRVTTQQGTGATDAEIAAAMALIYPPAMKNMLVSAANYHGLNVQKIFPLPPTVAVPSSVGAGPGLDTSEPLPRQVSGIITLRTAFAGRRYRGRIYIPFPGELANDPNGVPSVAYVTGLVALANLVLPPVVAGAGGNTSTLTSVLFHRDTNTTDAITNAVAQSKWATQRRRGSYGRPNIPGP